MQEAQAIARHDAFQNAGPCQDDDVAGDHLAARLLQILDSATGASV
ncbi:MAG: hypothetical protein R2844_20855 [Caldilineales bacterium]